MNKIILFSRPGLGLNSDEIQGIFSAMAESGFDWAANDEFAREAHDKAGVEIPAEKRYASIDAGLARGAVMLSYGGDGTFLEAVKLAYGCGVPVLGINYGHLGFLANTPREDMREVVGILRRGEYRIQPRTMLHVAGCGDFGGHP
nr:NAD(+)/NADH kinase [Tidjanibacter sp.]